MIASAAGIILTEQTAVPVISQLTPLITMALAAGLYYAAYRLSPPPVMDGHRDLTREEHAELLAAEPQ